jgi:hypothetical protein
MVPAAIMATPDVPIAGMVAFIAHNFGAPRRARDEMAALTSKKGSPEGGGTGRSA